MHSFQYYKAFLGHIVWILSVLYSCSSPSNTLPYNDEVHCGGEKLDSSSNFLVASNFSTIRFHGADIRDTNRSYTGRYSLQTNQANPYAFSLNLNDVKHGDFYEISIWRYGTDSSGFIVFSAEDPSLFYVKENRSLIVDSSGWELILLKVSIPYGLDNQSFKIYAWNSDSSQVWFDDLRIFKFEKEVFPEYSQDALSIYIDPEDMRKLNDKRRQAIRQGLLETEDDDWVDAIVFYGKIEMPAQVRLKGDWLDHLQGQKWSFRIKLKKGFTWNGMRTFSVQNPETRYFLFEWTAHEIFRSQDVLTTRYGFVPIMLNGISLGIYAYEEHFEKYLIEYNRRREGLIVKFSDEELWTVRRLQSTLKEPGLSMPDFDASSCIPFKASSIENDPALHEQFKMAQNLMWQYKNGLQTASLIFDVEKLARYFALQDIVRGFHALVWHNQRWYYNPALCRLEPILFDAYTSAGRYGWGGKNLSGDLIDEQINTNSPHLAMLYRLFQDKQFVEKYIYYLHKYTQVGFMENVMQQLNPQLKAYESQIKQEFPFYAYDYDFIVRQTAIIRRDLPAFEQRWKQDPRYAVRDSILHDNSEYDSLFHEDLPVKYVKAFSEVVHPDTMRIQIANYYTRNIVILGTGKNDYRIDYFILDKVSVPKYDKTLSSVDIASNPKVNFLFFMVEGIQQTLSVPILNWPAPQDYSSAQELLANSVFPYDGMYVVLSDSTVRFHKGRFSVNKTVVIPSGYKVLIQSGTSLNFKNGAGFVSYSPVVINGTKDSPVLIKSDDNSAGGFTVLQAGGLSTIKHCVFEGFSSLHRGGWQLTGGVTFYESPVDISYTEFTKSQSEDALNIIRTSFNLVHCKFSQSMRDAFDTDFCEGRVSDVSFREISNDALDFSGSTVYVDSCRISDTFDKGISCGEKSTIYISNSTIKDADIGIAAKDLSRVEVTNVVLTNTKYGVVAFRKKTEYGPAFISTDSLQFSNVKIFHLIEKGSVFYLNGDSIAGQAKNVADIFYPFEN